MKISRIKISNFRSIETAEIKHASDHAQTHGTKPWKYLLIAHDQVTEVKRLIDYLSFGVRA